jgi:flagellar assembly factor FliW
MIIDTARLGTIEYEESGVITFAQGIPGFKAYKKYIIIEIEESPFMYMQSVEAGDVSFVVASPFDFYQQYEFEVPPLVKKELQLHDENAVKVVNIVSIRGELSTATINLVAPIIINSDNNTGVQHILSDGQYLIRQPLFSTTDREEGGE